MFVITYTLKGDSKIREAGPYGSYCEALSHYYDINGYEGVTAQIVPQNNERTTRSNQSQTQDCSRS